MSKTPAHTFLSLADGGNTGAIWSTSCEADSAVDNAILVSCNANGNIITGDVAEAYDWHFVAPQQAHAKAAKRDFILTPVYIPEGSDSASQGCDRWERQCKGAFQLGLASYRILRAVDVIVLSVVRK
ncbi:hypothetical protein EMMF5_004125 [Cystobasidiomycetes sp. EMM_F5]